MRHTLKKIGFLFGLALGVFVISSSTVAASCGTIVQDLPVKKCFINNVYYTPYKACISDTINSPCCQGANEITECHAIATPTTAPTAGPTNGPTSAVSPTSGPNVNPLDPPTDAFFDLVDPLQHGGGQTTLEDTASPYANELKTPGGIVSRALTFAFPLAGLILFVMLVWAGFEILVGAPTKKSIDAGKQRATAAIVGFLLLFAAYWIFQIVEVVFGVKIL